jgi:hypothetical protein
VILGDPGCGKSTLSAHLAHAIAVDESPRVPFLVIVRGLSQALARGDRSMREHLASVARISYNVDLSVNATDYLLLNGRAVVILDALDELVDIALRDRVVRLIKGVHCGRRTAARQTELGDSSPAAPTRAHSAHGPIAYTAPPMRAVRRPYRSCTRRRTTPGSARPSAAEPDFPGRRWRRSWTSSRRASTSAPSPTAGPCRS